MDRKRDRERKVGPRLGGAQVLVVRRHLLFVALSPHCPDRHGPLLFGPNKSRWLKTRALVTQLNFSLHKKKKNTQLNHFWKLSMNLFERAQIKLALIKSNSINSSDVSISKLNDQIVLFIFQNKLLYPCMLCIKLLRKDQLLLFFVVYWSTEVTFSLNLSGCSSVLFWF